MKKNLFFILILIHSLPCLISQDTFSMHEFGKGANKYWIIIPETDQPLNPTLVVFLHGYGASNPACYGGWIDEILQTNHIVLFPQFQTGTWLPKPNKFEERVDHAIQSSVKYVKSIRELDVTDLFFVSHSIGGVISANLADRYGEKSAYKVSSLLLVQPGHKYLKLGSQKTYDHIDPDTRIVCVTGNKDNVASDRFTKLILSTTSQIPSEQKLWLEQFKFKFGRNKIGARHSEPISVDKKFDAGNRNIIISGSFLIGKTDEVDRNCYWRLTTFLLEKLDVFPYEFEKDSKELVSMGHWGKVPIRTLEVEY